MTKINERILMANFYIALLLTMFSLPAYATERSHTQRANFVKAHPCPATGKTKGACPNWVVDHIKPICAGGVDAPSNMQWQRFSESKIKDKEEMKLCQTAKRQKSFLTNVPNGS